MAGLALDSNRISLELVITKFSWIKGFLSIFGILWFQATAVSNIMESCNQIESHVTHL